MNGLAEVYRSIVKRDILLCSDEVRQADRRELYAAILDAIGIKGTSYLDELYDALVRYVSGRISKARRETTKKGRIADQDFDEC